MEVGADQVVTTAASCVDVQSAENLNNSRERGPDPFPPQSNTQQSKQVPLQKVSLKLIEKVCAAQSQNMFITPAIRSFFANVPSWKILEKVLFLDDCLVPNSDCATRDRQQAWVNYSSLYFKNLRSMRRLTGSPATSAWLCMELFRQMMDYNYPERGSLKKNSFSAKRC